MTPIPNVTPTLMKVRKFGIKLLLLAAAIAPTACNSDLVRENELPDKGCILTVDATKGQAVATRGLTSDLKAIWSEGDRVTVLSSTGATLGTMVPTSTGDYKTKLRATLNSPVQRGDQLTLVFPRTGRDYTGQKGTLDDIAANYDYATAQVEVQYADNTFVSASDAKFKNLQAIVRFNLQDKSSKAISVSSLTISADGLLQKEGVTGPVTITPATATNDIYAALSGINGKVTLTANAGNRTWSYTTTEVKSIVDGHYYPITCRMQPEAIPYPQPLTLESTEYGCNVWVTDYSDLEYYTNYEGKWQTYNGDIIQLDKNDWVSFRGTNSTDPVKISSSWYMNIHCNSLCYVYGNVMSLLSKDNFATMTTLPYDHTFRNLFKDNKNITHTDGKDLVLPATTLRSYCYSEMFSGCTSLNYIKCLATDIPTYEENCTYNWLDGVAEEGTFVKAQGFNGWPRDENGIPEGWNILEE